MKWETKARILYADTQWFDSAIAAGKTMDNRLNFIAGGPYGQSAPSNVFDMPQYLAFFDYEVLKRRGLVGRIRDSIVG